MRLGTIALLIGITFLSAWPVLPSATALWLIAIIASGLLLIAYYYRFTPLQLLGICLLGFCWSSGIASYRLHHALPDAVFNHNLSLIGTIISIPEQTNNGYRFILQVSSWSATISAVTSTTNISLHWANPHKKLQIGDTWQLKVHLQTPAEHFNPGNDNFSLWLLEQNIRALGEVIPNANNILITSHSWRYALGRLRQYLAEQISQRLEGLPLPGMINALVTGVRDQITPAQWQILRATGTNHLMAVAGLHIGFVAGIAYQLLNYSWRCSAVLALYLPAPQAAAIAALIAAFCYSALSGFALPAQRAIIMLSVFMISVLQRRQLGSWQAWSLALLIILLLDPLATLSASFWLSFSAVAIIIYACGYRYRVNGWWWRYGRIQWAIALGLIPISLYFFQQAALAGFIANALAIPWIGLIVLPLSLLGGISIIIAPHFATDLLVLAEKAMTIIWAVLSRIAAQPQLQWQQNIQQPWLMISACGAIILLLAPRGLPGRWLGFIWALPLLCASLLKSTVAPLQMTLLDLPQGLAAIIQTPHHALLYCNSHCVKAFSDQSMIESTLIALAIKRIDYLVSDDNPAELITDLNPTIAIGNVMTCNNKQQWQWDDSAFQYFPLSTITAKTPHSSCALIISHNQIRLWLVDNLTTQTAATDLMNTAEPSKQNILISSYYQSHNKALVFLSSALKPKLILLAIDNRHKHIAACQQLLGSSIVSNATCHTTTDCGAIDWQLQDDSHNANPSYGLQCYRQTHRYFWNNHY